MSGDTATKKAAIAAALEQLAGKMSRISESMESIREPGWLSHAYELQDAAEMVLNWAEGIKEEVAPDPITERT